MAWKNVPSMKKAVEAFLVFQKDEKTIDIPASDAKFHDCLMRHNAGVMAEQELITKCIHELYDQFKGANLNMDYLKSQVIEKMKKIEPALGDPSLFGFLVKRVKETVDEMTGDDKPLGFKKGVGHYRRADQKASA
jgi:hypothetical protein